MTIYDIANKAKVSTATVSRVLNGSDKVTDETKKRILAVIEAEGFTPNIFARGLGLHSIKMIGILCTDIADYFYALAVSYLERMLNQNGYNFILCCTGTEPEGKQNKINVLLEKHVDAIILIGSAFNEGADNARLERAAKKTPMVIINGYIQIPNIYCVLCDESAAMAYAAKRLIESGCKDILFFYESNTYSSNQKKSGYLQALKSQNIPVNNDLVLFVKRYFDAVDAQIKRLADSNTVFDAILTTDDFLAVGAQKSLSSLNRVVPIIGFDNSILASCATPSLTSVDNNLEQMCEIAVDTLVQVFNGKKPVKKTVVEGNLVERDTFKSTAYKY